MAIFNFSDLSKSAKIGYNALYNVVFSHSTSFNAKSGLNKFTVPLCLNSDNKVSLTEKNFIFFDSVLSELKLYPYASSCNLTYHSIFQNVFQYPGRRIGFGSVYRKYVRFLLYIINSYCYTCTAQPETNHYRR